MTADGLRTAAAVMSAVAVVDLTPLRRAMTTDLSGNPIYDRKRAQGKRHNQALIALARCRCDVLFAMLRDGTFYEPPTASAA